MAFKNKPLKKKIKKYFRESWYWRRRRKFFIPLFFYPKNERRWFKYRYQQKVISKRKIKYAYNISKLKPFKNTLKKAQHKLDSFSNIELRLDILLMRTGLFGSPFLLKQVISHKKVFVNGIPVNKGGFLLKQGDYISFDLSLHKRLNFYLWKWGIRRRLMFPHFEINFRIFKIIVMKDKLSLSDLTVINRYKGKLLRVFSNN